MKSLQAYKEEQLKDPAFAAAYAEIKSEMDTIRANIETTVNDKTSTTKRKTQKNH